MSTKKYTIVELKKICKKNNIKGYNKINKKNKKEFIKKCEKLIPKKKINKIIIKKKNIKSLEKIQTSVRRIVSKYSDKSPDLIIKNATKRLKDQDDKINNGNTLTILIMLSYLLKKHQKEMNFAGKKDFIKLLDDFHKKKIKDEDINESDYSIFIELSFGDVAEPLQIYFDKDFKKNLTNFKKSNKRFTFYLLSLVAIEGWGHANFMVFDNKHNTFYRFDPNGDSYFYNNSSLNKMFDEELKRFDPSIKYISLADFCPLLVSKKDKTKKVRGGPQAIEARELKERQKNDPSGFCLYWSFILMDFIMTNFKRKNFKNKTVPEYLKLMMDDISKKFVSYRQFIRTFAVIINNVSKNFEKIKDINIYMNKLIKSQNF
jgi:hypothetical protein